VLASSFEPVFVWDDVVRFIDIIGDLRGGLGMVGVFVLTCLARRELPDGVALKLRDVMLVLMEAPEFSARELAVRGLAALGLPVDRVVIGAAVALLDTGSDVAPRPGLLARDVVRLCAAQDAAVLGAVDLFPLWRLFEIPRYWPAELLSLAARMVETGLLKPGELLARCCQALGEADFETKVCAAEVILQLARRFPEVRRELDPEDALAVCEALDLGTDAWPCE
jgi:hypothetical protein